MLIFVVIGEYHRVSPHISTKDDDPGVSSMPDSMSSTIGALGCFPVVAAGSSNAGSVDGGSSGSSSMITRSCGTSFGRGMRGRGSVRAGSSNAGSVDGGSVDGRSNGSSSMITHSSGTSFGRGMRGRGSVRGGRHGRGRRRGSVRGCSSTRGGRGRGSTSHISQLETVSDPWVKEESSAFCFNYERTPGPTNASFDSNSSILDFFARFFTEEVWTFLVTETNRYADNNRIVSPSSRAWSPVSVQEMKAFVGILILMGILKLPRLEMYWSKQHPHIATPGISDIMSRIRFQQIFRFFHLSTSSEQVHSFHQPGYDRLFKVRKFLDLVSPKFEQEYIPHKQVSIDEAMIPFKGRLSFKQYMKDKPVKWGIKVFVLSDAHNGYVYRLQVYTGKDLNTVSDVGLCSKVVLDLMSGLESFHNELFTDNYYTSPSLYMTLYKNGVNACETVRSSRKGFPQELLTKATASNRSFYDFRSSGPLLAAVWIDKRSIYFLSTMHIAEAPGVTVKRRKLDRSQDDISCPPLLPDYQAYMRGVDRGDQLIGYYNAGRRSK